MNLKFLTYTVKSKIFAGVRRVFLSITFLFTPIQLIQFFHWKLFKSKRSTTTQTSKDSLIDHGKLDENKAQAKVAIILHVFYPDIGIEILNQVLPKSSYFNKILITHSMTPTVLNEFQSNVPDDLLSKCLFVIVENRLRDCGPFIQAACSPFLSDCEVFLKLHTKKSPHLPNDEGALWRRDLINGLLNPKDIENLISQLAASPEPLWACPDRWISSKSDWGFNSFQVWRLTRKIGIPFQGPQPFPLGNMYWLNSLILSDFKSLTQSVNLGSEILLNFLNDGHWTHALERIPSSYENRMIISLTHK
jgi:lipopolysaccharide biosynthesis protein